MAVYLGNNKLTFDGISEIYVGSNKVYSAAPPIDYSTEYFFVENLTSSSNTLSIKKSNSSAPTITVYRSTDKTSWTSMGSTSTTALTYSIPANSKIYLRATANNWGSSIYYNSITCSGNHAIGGNIMSLIYGSSFIGKTVFPSSSTYNFTHLFFVSTNLKNINNLVLPATTLTDYCYYYMFGSSGLTSIPSNLLPATTLADYCYGDMFSSTSITSIPSNLLPATTLANNCYSSMFSGTSITSIPSNFLPATTLTEYCYSYMFSWSTGLTTVPEDLLPATTLASGCYSGMFSGCFGLTKSPELPATTLVDTCYQGMFRSCSSLNEITCYADDISAFWCTKDWLNGVAATGTFYKKGTASWVIDSVDGVPTGWTVVEEIPYDPINDYFWVENITDSSITVSFGGGPAYQERANLEGQLSDSYPKVQYSTDKTTWSGGTGGTRSFTVPAKTRIYLRSVSGMTTGSSTYYYFGNPSSGPIWMSVYGWGAILYNSYSFYYLTLFSSKLSPSVNHSITVGGNIRTILGYADSGVGNTTGLSYNRSYYNKGNSYCSERYWNGLGKETTTGSTSNAQSGLYFSGIKDASQLYIGTTDVRPDFVNTPSDFVGPIYT